MEVKTGFPNITNLSEEAILLNEFDISNKIESEIKQFYKSSFLYLNHSFDKEDDLSELRGFPEEIKDVFSEQTLHKMAPDLVWIKVQFPGTLPAVALNDIFCAINCFPAVNRKLNEFTYRLNEGLNLVALPSTEEFFSVHDVTADDGYKYKSNPLTNSTNELSGTYILRQGGVERFDVRNATQFINYMIDLLRDESAAFSVMGNDFLSANIKQLNQTLAILEQRSVLKGDKRDSTAYLIVNPRSKGENLFVTFWSTNGEFANGFRAATKMDFYSGADITSENLILLTAASGGRPKLNDLERLSAYKNTLTSRERIVTLQDIRMFCVKELGNAISEVETNKGFIHGSDSKAGFIRIIDVVLTPAKKSTYSSEDWENICYKLQIELENNSSGIIPIKVSTKK